MGLINNIYCQLRNSLASSFPKNFKYCERYKSIIKFFITGLLSGAIDIFVLYLVHELLGRNIIFSTSIAFIFAFFISFNIQKVWTFRNYDRNNMPRQLSLYFTNAIIIFLLNGLAMHYLVNNLQFCYLLAQIMVNIVLGSINFINYKYIIFKTESNENNII